MMDNILQWESSQHECTLESPLSIRYAAGYMVAPSMHVDPSPLTASSGIIVLSIFVLSAPDDVGRRSILRKTWFAGSDHQTGPHFWAYCFIVGTAGLSNQELEALHEERRRFLDIGMIPMAESYHNLTLKSLIAVLGVPYDLGIPLPRFLVRMNSNNRIQPARLANFLGSMPEDLANHHYPNGFIWGFRHCATFDVLYGACCGTLPINIPLKADLLVDGDLIPYPAGAGFVLSRTAYVSMRRAYDQRVRDIVILPTGRLEDLFI